MSVTIAYKDLPYTEQRKFMILAGACEGLRARLESNFFHVLRFEAAVSGDLSICKELTELMGKPITVTVAKDLAAGVVQVYAVVGLEK